MAHCPVCDQPMLSEWPHAHTVKNKYQDRLDDDLARRVSSSEQQKGDECQ